MGEGSSKWRPITPIHQSPLSCEKEFCNSTEKAHGPRAFPSTTGLSDNCRLGNNCPFCFHRASTNQQKSVPECGNCRKFIYLGLGLMQLVSAGTDLHPRAGRQVPRTQGSHDALPNKRTSGRGWLSHYRGQWEEGGTLSSSTR